LIYNARHLAVALTQSRYFSAALIRSGHHFKAVCAPSVDPEKKRSRFGALTKLPPQQILYPMRKIPYDYCGNNFGITT
jgi:hypothetical protein